MNSTSAENPDSSSGSPPTAHDVERLLPQVDDELRRLAQHVFRQQSTDHTLQPTALVHEAYLRLSDADEAKWSNRCHFYCVAAKAMRQILINHARDRGRQKRGGGWKRVPLEGSIPVGDDDGPDLESLHNALDISAATVKLDWAFSKAWLLESLLRFHDPDGEFLEEPALGAGFRVGTTESVDISAAQSAAVGDSADAEVRAFVEEHREHGFDSCKGELMIFLELDFPDDE
jgi:hypothetical protein